MKKILSVLLVLSTSLLHAEALPTVLSESDAEAYVKIFDLQDKNQFDSAKKMESGIENKILMGEVLYHRYMSKGYYSRGVEVAEWMNKYADHPGADNIFKLSKKKKILVRAPALPSPASAKSETGAYNESYTTKKYYGSTGSYVGQFQRAQIY